MFLALPCDGKLLPGLRQLALRLVKALGFFA